MHERVLGAEFVGVSTNLLCAASRAGESAAAPGSVQLIALLAALKGSDTAAVAFFKPLKR